MSVFPTTTGGTRLEEHAVRNRRPRDLKAKPPREENQRDPDSEGSGDWNPKDNLWENYAHDSCMGNTEATHARARNQGAPGEKKGK